MSPPGRTVRTEQNPPPGKNRFAWLMQDMLELERHQINQLDDSLVIDGRESRE
jgi:hypothetical protein